MTSTQKKIITCLLEGGSVASCNSYGFRLRNSEVHPVMVFTARTWYHIRKLCRRQKGAFVIDKRIVRGLHGRHFAKKEYNRIATLRKASAQDQAHPLAS